MMNMTDLQCKISALFKGISFQLNEPMSKHTSFRIGGPAEVVVFPKSVEELAFVLKTSDTLDCNVYILGAGTNVLVPDTGVRGLVICLKDCLDGIELLDNSRIRVYAGVTMSRAAVFAAVHDLGGMEFAHGIPGTIGGGVYMNAGAYGGTIDQICESVQVMTRSGVVKEFLASEMDFSYRHSRLEDSGDIVISAVFSLEPKPESAVRQLMQELMAKRKASQPLDLPSAGSAFKRPVGGYAAALIDQAGLKGLRVGGAAISEKHAGFVVNLGGATCNDVLKLLKLVSDKVYEDSNIQLEPEVRIW